jgi:hypothetical protein
MPSLIPRYAIVQDQYYFMAVNHEQTELMRED